MTQLMRKNLRSLYDKATDANAGLLIQRGLIEFDQEEKKRKKDLLTKLAGVRPSAIYHLALKRWLNKTYSEDLSSSFRSFAARVEGRLMTGLSLGGALETGVTTQHAYGMPMIAGSSVKGAVRAYTELLYGEKNSEGKPLYTGEGINRKPVIAERYIKTLEALFGTDEDAETQDAGYIIWHDALWLPPMTSEDFSKNDDSKPFMEDIITVHHQEYYSGNETRATGMESPIPNQQLAVQGAFYFVLEGAPQWVEYAKKLLTETIQHRGLGAKTSSGYGYFVLDDTLTNRLKAFMNKQEEIAATSQTSDDPYHIARIKIKNFSEQELIESFSNKINPFFRSLELDRQDKKTCQALATIAYEYHQDIIDNLNTKNKNSKRAHKFITDNKS